MGCRWPPWPPSASSGWSPRPCCPPTLLHRPRRQCRRLHPDARTNPGPWPAASNQSPWPGRPGPGRRGDHRVCGDGRAHRCRRLALVELRGSAFGTQSMPGRVPLRRVRAGEVRVRTFSTISRPARRAAASGGRPAAGDPSIRRTLAHATTWHTTRGSSCLPSRSEGRCPPVGAASLAGARDREGEAGPAGGPASPVSGCRRFGYWRAMAIRVSASLSTMRSPERSTVALYRVPVNRNGAW